MRERNESLDVCRAAIEARNNFLLINNYKFKLLGAILAFKFIDGHISPPNIVCGSLDNLHHEASAKLDLGKRQGTFDNKLQTNRGSLIPSLPYR
jgi:hypothetical protein